MNNAMRAVPFKADRNYIPTLDGLRAISVLFVVLRHFDITRLVSANLGVTIFFFISGFIITRLMLHEHETTGEIKVFAFYLRRFFRLIPELFLMLVVVVAFALILSVQIDWGQVFAGFFYYMNYYTVFLRHNGLDYTLPINHLWSLAVEEHYYLIFPLFVLLFIKRLHIMLRVIIGLLATILLWRLFNIHVLEFTPKYNYFATESRIGTILWGCLLSVLAHRSPKNLLMQILKSPWVGLIAGAILMGTMFIPGEENRHSWRYSLQGLCLLLSVGPLLFSPGLGWARGLLSLKPMTFLGKISYSLYLWHLPVYFFLPKVITLSKPLSLVLALSLSLLIATASYYLFAKPLMARHRQRQNKVRSL